MIAMTRLQLLARKSLTPTAHVTCILHNKTVRDRRKSLARSSAAPKVHSQPPRNAVQWGARVYLFGISSTALPVSQITQHGRF